MMNIEKENFGRLKGVTEVIVKAVIDYDFQVMADYSRAFLVIFLFL